MKRSRYIVAIVLAIFFVISLVTNILGPLIPDIIQSFHLSLFAAALLPFSFFIAYGVFSIPAGFLVERWGEKKVILWMFSIALLGSLIFRRVAHLSRCHSLAVPHRQQHGGLAGSH